MLPLPCRVPYHSIIVRTELLLTFMERDKEWGPHGNLPWTFLWLGLHLGHDHLLSICLWRVQRSSPSLQNCYTHSQDHHRISVERRKIKQRRWKVSYSITFHSHSEFKNKQNIDITSQDVTEMVSRSVPSRVLVPSETHEGSLSWLHFSILVFWASPE